METTPGFLESIHGLRVRLNALAVLPAILAATAAGAAPVVVTYVLDPSSEWELKIDPAAGLVAARHRGSAEILLEIDYDGTEDDRRHPGITPVLGSRRLEGLFWGDLAPLIYPVLDPEEHRIERVTVDAEGDRLRVRFEGGSYRILNPAAGEEPLYAEAVFQVQDGRLRVDLDGLYYILLSQQRTRLAITSRGEGIERLIETVPGSRKRTRVTDGQKILHEVSSSSEQFIEYFEEVTAVDIEDEHFGHLELATSVDRLQLQVDRLDDSVVELFELDFDHTFKDRGQRAVLSHLLIELTEAQQAGQEEN